MATPISKTWLQMQTMGIGGLTCPEVQAYIDQNHPGTTDASVFDVLEWMEAMRSRGLHSYVFPSVIREMSATQRRDLIVWALNQIKANLPGGWSGTAAASARIDEYVSCLNAPSGAKRAAIQSFASSLTIDWADSRSRYLNGTLKGLGNLIGQNINDHADVTWMVKRLMSIAVNVLGTNELATKNAVMTQIQRIIGVID